MRAQRSQNHTLPRRHLPGAGPEGGYSQPSWQYSTLYPSRPPAPTRSGGRHLSETVVSDTSSTVKCVGSPGGPGRRQAERGSEGACPSRPGPQLSADLKEGLPFSWLPGTSRNIWSALKDTPLGGLNPRADSKQGLTRQRGKERREHRGSERTCLSV